MSDVFYYDETSKTAQVVYETIQNRCVERELADDPFYIVHLEKIRYSYQKWILHLPYIKPFYAVKCNSNPALLTTLNSLGCNFDCASKSEMEKIMQLTKDPDRIIFANPCKITTHLQYAKQHKISLMTVDSENELHKIKTHYPEAKVLLRLAVEEDTHSITSFNIKFGCPLKHVEKMFILSKQLDMPIHGFSFHVGSGCMNPLVYKKALQSCKECCILSKKYDIDIKIIDIGGGFWGVDTPQFNFKEVADAIHHSIQSLFFEEIEKQTIRFIAEPGRYFAQESHTLVCNVINKKETEQINKCGELEKIIKYYLNDGIYGSFNCILTDHAKIKFGLFNKDKNKDKDPVLYKSMIFGPTCDSYDIITQKETFLMPEMNCGDWLYIENFGAYTVSSSSDFNGFRVKDIYYV